MRLEHRHWDTSSLLRHGERERLAHRRDPHVLSFWLEENLDVVAFPHRPLEQGGVESSTGGTKLDLVEPRRAPLQHGHGCSTSVAPPRQNYPATVALPKHRLPGTHPWAKRSLRGCYFASLASPLLQRILVFLQPGRFTTRFGCLVRRGSSKQISFVSIIAGSKLGVFA